MSWLAVYFSHTSCQFTYSWGSVLWLLYLNGLCPSTHHLGWHLRHVLGAFAKLRKATFSFVICVRLSVRMEQLGCHWKEFHEFWHLNIFGKSFKKNQVPLKVDKNMGTLHEDLFTFLIPSLSVLFRVGHVSYKICREYQNTHFVLSNFFRKIMPFVRQCGKYL